MLTPFLDFAATAGPVLGSVVIIGLLLVPCVIVWLVLKKPHTGKRVSVSVLGKLVKVDIEDVQNERAEQPPALGAEEQPKALPASGVQTADRGNRSSKPVGNP
ncbi:hypothetical protein ACQPYE_08330 [Actinosynnema sp. CA-299493]